MEGKDYDHEQPPKHDAVGDMVAYFYAPGKFVNGKIVRVDTNARQYHVKCDGNEQEVEYDSFDDPCFDRMVAHAAKVTNGSRVSHAEETNKDFTDVDHNNATADQRQLEYCHVFLIAEDKKLLEMTQNPMAIVENLNDTTATSTASKQDEYLTQRNQIQELKEENEQLKDEVKRLREALQVTTPALPAPSVAVKDLTRRNEELQAQVEDLTQCNQEL